ncbi:MAG TPA: ABC transporter ATP-binding protein [candidate division WOR-3 bacterium]|uniref:ABC transporter ATP-binding protein n=1 Tax=candidate division WOR-3 bacterium TaxID=2052148 RepID=A0A7C0ZHS1_UNCW3|nr:ABC transporter ATP-binding protein [candidate division WOR-3 bacterium]
MEESKRTGVLNTKIYRWMAGYLKVFTLQLLINLILLLIATGVDLSLPYIVKIGVDRFIVPGVREITKELPGKPVMHIGNRKFIEIFRFHQRELEKMERDGIVLKKKYYLVKKEDLVPGLSYIEMDGLALVPAEEFGKLSLKEKLHLRRWNMLQVRRLAMIFFLLIVLRFFFTYTQFLHLQVVGQKVALKIRRDIVEKLVRLSISYFEKNPVGRLVTRATNDVNTLNEMFTSVVVYFVKDIFVIVGILVIMAKLSTKLFLITLILIPIISITTFIFRTRVRRVFRELRYHLARINTFLSETLSGIKEIQAFVQEHKMMKRFNGINTDYFKTTIRMLIIFATFRPLIGFIRFSGLALLIYFGGKGILSGVITFGSLVAFISYLEKLFQPIADIAERYNVIESSMAASERVYILLGEEEEKRTGRKKPSIKGGIEFENVWFSYNQDEWVLKDISFFVKPGEKIGVVGYTGAGKTTLMKLLTKFYSPQKGKILIDGVDIEEIDTLHLRKNIATVYQEPFLFNGTIRENITLFCDIPEERLLRAIRVSNLDRVMERKGIGLDTVIGIGGEGLSGGEKQLITFARAIAFDTPILVLDEATASIDPQTEHLVQEALYRVIEGRTSIIIAHRLATLKRVDRIIVIHNGKLIEEGTHEELIKKEGIYSYLYRLQQVG